MRFTFVRRIFHPHLRHLLARRAERAWCHAVRRMAKGIVDLNDDISALIQERDELREALTELEKWAAVAAGQPTSAWSNAAYSGALQKAREALAASE